MTARFYCLDCEDWTPADASGTTADCTQCGEPYRCGDCGFEIDHDGRCLRAEYGDGKCPARTP